MNKNVEKETNISLQQNEQQLEVQELEAFDLALLQGCGDPL